MPDTRPLLPGVLITVDVDAVTPMIDDVSRTRVNDHLDEVEQRLFGLRHGVPRILQVLDEYAIRATFFIPGLVAARAPEVVRSVVDAGHEIGLHGWHHTSARGRASEDLRAEIRRAVAALKAAGAPEIRGHRAPEWHMTMPLLDALLSEGLDYDSSTFGDESPHVLAHERRHIVEIPVSWALDDAPYLLCTSRSVRPIMSARELGAQWQRDIDQYIRQRQLAVLTVHPWIIGRSASLVALEMACAHVRTRNVWTGTAGDLFDQMGRLGDMSIVDVLEGRGWWFE